MPTKRAAHVRVVAADEKPAKSARPKTLTEAIEGGDYREILLAQRREIAASLPGEKGPAKAALHRQLSLISKEIEGLDAAANEGADESGDVKDEAFDASAV